MSLRSHLVCSAISSPLLLTESRTVIKQTGEIFQILSNRNQYGALSLFYAIILTKFVLSIHCKIISIILIKSRPSYNVVFVSNMNSFGTFSIVPKLIWLKNNVIHHNLVFQEFFTDFNPYITDRFRSIKSEINLHYSSETAGSTGGTSVVQLELT